MNETSTEKLIQEFFDRPRRHGKPDLLLPDGWFGGRPFDNMHELSFVCERPKRLLIELDDHILLSFVGLYTVQEMSDHSWVEFTHAPALRIEHYARAIVEYISYGQIETPGLMTYDSGAVLLV